MADKVEVDPELLRQASAKTSTVTDRLRAALTGLESAINGKGEPWGSDSYGEKFAKGEDGNGYTAARESLTKLAADTSTTTDNQSNAQQDSSKLHDNTEQTSADSFK